MRSLLLVGLAVALGVYLAVFYLVGAYENFFDSPHHRSWGFVGLLLAAAPGVAFLLTYRRGRALGLGDRAVLRRSAWFTLLTEGLTLVLLALLAAPI